MRRVDVFGITFLATFGLRTNQQNADYKRFYNADQLWPSSLSSSSAMLACMSKILPGLAVAFAAAGVSWVIAQLLAPVVPGLSALLVAIILGVVWRNLFPVSSALIPGLAVAAKPVLRLGIVLLGFQLSLTEIAALGVPVIVVIVAAVVLTFGFTAALGNMLKVPPKLSLLVASGFSICGAAAVAGADSVLKPKREHSATALGLVVLNGTVMIAVMPLLFLVFSPDVVTAGVWTGAAVHEVAQVVAVGQNLGQDGLNVAVTVKLGRVLLLALVMAALAIYMRRATMTAESGGAKRPPIIPLFVVGFAAAMLLGTTGVIPEAGLDVLAVVQTIFLTTAMFSLGMGVHLKSLLAVGGRPVVLAAASTTFITVLGGFGALVAV